jgi:hypothetical protein
MDNVAAGEGDGINSNSTVDADGIIILDIP